MRPAVLLAALAASVALAHKSGTWTNSIAVRLSAGVDALAFAADNDMRYVGPIEILPRYHVFSGRNKSLAARRAMLRARSLPSVEWAQEQFARPRAKRVARAPEILDPTDPLYATQWHLQRLETPRAWSSGATGEGVTIAIVDDGLEFDHPDIEDNYAPEASWDFNTGKAAPYPAMYDDHGTSAAGVAAARDNDVCGVGVAPRARLSGVRLISQVVPDATEACGLSYRLELNDIVSCSWGPTDDGRRLEGPGPLGQLAMKEAVTVGRGGLGTIYVWAAGNGRRSGDNCNYDGYANSRYTIAVGSVGADLSQSWYSENCASLMAVLPSSHTGQPSIATTDLMGSRGTSLGPCTSSFGGTSASAPMLSGVVALMLSAAPERRLTYRDVQHIVVRSTWRNLVHDDDWTLNGGGFWHSHKFGFGVVNASRAVELARVWDTVGKEQSWSSGRVVVGAPVPAGVATPVRSRTLVDAELHVEWIEVTVAVSAPHRGDMTISLTSPSGVTSVLQETHNDSNPDIDWTYTSCRHWGERSRGDWELAVMNTRVGRPGALLHWEITVYGTTEKPSL